ncbi:MAG: cytoskeletal protein CcmA (bactofilin family) [Candidatus Azotimanducaceae bacterium]|jgi:cytoskeletal protein CcmA (bactofilin family)
MFGKKKAFHSARIDTLVGRGTEIRGDFLFTGGLHIDGLVVGNVVADDSSSAILILSEFGRIEGEIKVANMVLNGNVIGDIHASSRVELAPKARIKGSVYYNLIEMSVGAEVNGALVHCPKDDQPQRAIEDKSAGDKGEGKNKVKESGV